jgi:hypothetical protein
MKVRSTGAGHQLALLNSKLCLLLKDEFEVVGH